MKKFTDESTFGQLLIEFQHATIELHSAEQFIEDMGQDMSASQKTEYAKIIKEYEVTKKKLLNHLGYEYSIEEELDQD